MHPVWCNKEIALFFKITTIYKLKEATTGLGSLVKRMFITGVSPVTLDGVTSSFNIAEPIKPAWNLDLTSFWDLRKKKGGITTKEQLHNEKLVLAKYRIKFQHHNLPY